MNTVMDTRDWSLCFLCQSVNCHEKTCDPSVSIKLKNSHEKLQACYQEVVENVHELKQLGFLPRNISIDDIDCGGSGGGGNGDGVQDVI